MAALFPIPLTVLTELFAKLHDKNFRIAIPGFYDDVAAVPAVERKALNALPWKEKDFEQAVGAPSYHGEKGFTTVERLWIRPTLELNGIWGGYQGEGAKTVIPSKAYAKFSTRLVPNQNPQKIAKLVEKHIRKLLPKSVHCRFEVLSTGKPWGGSLQSADFFRWRSLRCKKVLAKKGCLHPRRGFHPVRHPDARHL